MMMMMTKGTTITASHHRCRLTIAIVMKKPHRVLAAKVSRAIKKRKKILQTEYKLLLLIVPKNQIRAFKLKAHHSAPIVLGEQRMLTKVYVAYI